MTVQYLADGNPDGTIIGGSADKLGFFGLATAIAKPQITVVTTANKTTTLNELDISRLRAALVSLGIVGTGG